MRGRRRFGAMAAVVAVAVVLAACADGGATHALPSAVPTASEPTGEPPGGSPAPAVSAPPSTLAPSAPPRTGAPTRSPARPRPRPSSQPPAPPVVGSGPGVYVLGDSVLLGAKTTLPIALRGWRVTMDCVGSRRLPQGIEVLRAQRPRLGPVVVIQLGNNHIPGEGSYAGQIDQAMTVLRGIPRVVWLTVAEKYPSRAEINRAIRAAPARWPAIRVVDWATAVAAHPEYAEDDLHLSPAGREAIARMIAPQVGPPPA